MITQLRKVGKGNILILDKPILDLLGLEEDGQVQLVIQGGHLIVTPTQARPASPEQVEETLEYVLEKRTDLLRRLAQ